MTSCPVDHSLRHIGRNLADGSSRAVDLVAQTIARLELALNAYFVWTPKKAIQQEQAADAAFAAGRHLGDLQCVPVPFKDLNGITGLPTFAGTPCSLPDERATVGPVTQSLRRQSAEIMGKTHTVEFAFGGLGTSCHHPVPWNPRDRATHRAPGRSSSGAGVLVAELSTRVAFGTDKGGSVRIPTRLTGTVGLKTMLVGRSSEGIVRFSPSFDTPGLLTRSSDGAGIAFEQLDAPRLPDLSPDTPLRIGVAEPFFSQDCSPGIAQRMAQALRLIEHTSATLTDLSLPSMAEVCQNYHYGGIVSAEIFAFLNGTLPAWLDTLDPGVRRRMEDGSALEAWRYLYRKARYAELPVQVAAVFDICDVIVSPTVPLTSPSVALLQDEAPYAVLNLQMLRNTCVVSFLGLCAVTISAGLDAAGMPVESRLLAIARLFEDRGERGGIWQSPRRTNGLSFFP
ncbi:MAG: amidase [Paracoccaceae bacterium]